MCVHLSLIFCFFLSGTSDALIVTKKAFEYNIRILIDLMMWAIALLLVAYLLLRLSDPAKIERNQTITRLVFAINESKLADSEDFNLKLSL